MMEVQQADLARMLASSNIPLSTKPVSHVKVSNDFHILQAVLVLRWMSRCVLVRKSQENTGVLSLQFDAQRGMGSRVKTEVRAE